MDNMVSSSRHPYYPTSLAFEGYAPASIRFEAILGLYALGTVLLVAATWALSGRTYMAACLAICLAIFW